MWKSVRTPLLLALICAPGFAAAAQCDHQEPRALTLDIKGVQSVSIQLRSHDLHLRGTDGNGGAIRGRACASSADLLKDLTVTQRKEGSKLVIEVGPREGVNLGSLFGRNRYAYLDLGIAFPKSLPVELDVGSGDADVDNVARLSAHTGSGDLNVRRVAGLFDASVGSGDIEASGIGSLRIDSVGSGDLKATDVRGDATIGTIGSGDAVFRDVDGSVTVDLIGSGDLSVDDVAGSLRVRHVGSGDISHSGVRGQVDIPRQDD